MKVRKVSASRRPGGFGFLAVLVVALVWWAPTIAVALVEVGIFHLGTYRLVLRARRLRLAGRLDEALVALEQAEARVAGRQR